MSVVKRYQNKNMRATRLDPEWCEGRRVFVKKFSENPMNICTDAVFETIITENQQRPQYEWIN